MADNLCYISLFNRIIVASFLLFLILTISASCHVEIRQLDSMKIMTMVMAAAATSNINV